ncbi:uncharacterized protein BYT42DRAFT_488447 [Radiomyces spectabilis]|uniref:uncharacterized protein n=1 Tax=Radiomyces spectabilis TaxID=64574 RepID=UPI00221F2E09|nr:uncharacterized protein BYT42DRAFT_488447 [Radiomyces spectabilis]KAI8394301.1 hypothetical protein BYT42DRAFT_488447 [Radiomyces spectabilis]
MSLDERRRRNKIASARYRAKKQEKVKAMSSKVNQLMAVNANLQKSLEIVKLENGALRRLVQSLMAQKEASTKHLPQS